MKYVRHAPIWITYFGFPDMSLGVHLCCAGRVDFHFLFWMVSIGNVPLYRHQNGKLLAVSNSMHKRIRGNLEARAGNAGHRSYPLRK